MPKNLTDLHPVSRITIGAVGPPGKRTFLLQASYNKSTITLKIEKEQARMLATSTIELLDELDDHYPPQSTAKTTPPLSADLMLQEPVEPEFVVGQIGLGYDQEEDMVVLVVQEIEIEPTDEPVTVRLWATRTQMRTLSDHTLEVVNQGRPICPLCDMPIDPDGHFCPKTNGYERVTWV